MSTISTRFYRKYLFFPNLFVNTVDMPILSLFRLMSVIKKIDCFKYRFYAMLKATFGRITVDNHQSIARVYLHLYTQTTPYQM